MLIAQLSDPHVRPNGVLYPGGGGLHSWSDRDGLVSHTVQLGTFAGPDPFA
ncbi:3',5'-cyclic adenosine monophosphate phosphodies terase CpdA [Mycolicibacterium canariasense]|uniref:3',5'-cyclic adenosine monophosphate phosphodies terase CpdA n=1 Tax=Mycolicibacterium canariasense TaxID=228230 RepID=A0A100WA38_MYCCR|nr:3',5'-cyclic adenosine monophosphate phosphodies terase CpdA [Mycolicibacterium canariasense]